MTENETHDGPATGAQVDKLARKVDGLRDDLRRKYLTARKALRVAFAALALAVAAGVGGFLTLRHESASRDRERAEAAVTTCQNGNATRQAITDRFARIDALIAAVARVGGAPVRALIDAYLAEPASPALAARDCAPAAALNPAPLPTTTGDGSGGLGGG